MIDAENCEVIGFKSDGDQDETYVCKCETAVKSGGERRSSITANRVSMMPAEHIVELSYLAELLRFMVSGEATKPDFKYVARKGDHGYVGVAVLECLPWV
ncbi:hypothetical protein IMZ48_46485 [Candidatus Bathyarchaeota archaeon]|nr:hypothetical protein [Candidatus Bathyarchaeota archaeon]